MYIQCRARRYSPGELRLVAHLFKNISNENSRIISRLWCSKNYRWDLNNLIGKVLWFFLQQ